MASQWILHVKKYQSDHPGMSYKDSMSKARLTYKPVKKQGGRKIQTTKPVKKQKGGSSDDNFDEVGVIDSIVGATSQGDELLDAAKLGLDFTSSVLTDPTRVRRVEKRQDRRDTRAKRRQSRRQEAKDIKQDRKNEKQELKTDKIRHKREIKEKKHQRRLDRI